MIVSPFKKYEDRLSSLYKDYPAPIQFRAILMFRIFMAYYLIILPGYLLINVFYWSYIVCQIVVFISFYFSIKTLFKGDIQLSGDLFYLLYIANFIVVIFPGNEISMPENPEILYRTTSILILFTIVIFLVSFRPNQIFIHLFASVLTLITRYLILVVKSRIQFVSNLYHLVYTLILVLFAAIVAHFLVKYYQGLVDLIHDQDIKILETLTQVIDGFIPICANCKSIKKDSEQWVPIEKYIHGKSKKVHFSHGLCPNCANKLYPEYMDS